MIKIKESRVASFIVVALVYALAIEIGLITYAFMPLNNYWALLIADIVATIVVFIFSLIFGNASMYDPYWSVQPIVILTCFMIGRSLNAIKILFFIVVALWGVRLTANWAYTFKNLKSEDWRYGLLREKTGKWYPLVNFFGIHMVPTLIVYACILPAVFVMQSGVNNVFAFIFIVISLLAATMQGFADVQMHKFRKNKTTENFIKNGLWTHSRHPTYLGEILMWWGVGLASVFATSWAHWYLLVGAMLNTLMFMFISIPMADKKQSTKAGFEEYKEQTNMLLPLPIIFKNIIKSDDNKEIK